jgi:hypothetical protein
MEIINYDDLYEQAIVDFSNKIGLSPKKIVNEKYNLTDFIPERRDTQETTEYVEPTKT